MKQLLIILLCLTSINLQAQKQGLCGKVVWTAGNQMPGPDRKDSGSKAISREVFIYEATTASQTTEENGFYSNIQTKLIAKVKSKSNGTFSVKLPPGTYSVFVKEPRGLWANIFDGQGWINPITVTSKNWTRFTLDVNYEAAY